MPIKQEPSTFIALLVACKSQQKQGHFQFYSALVKWLLGANMNSGKWPLKFWGLIWPNDSFVPGLNQHQGVFWPDHPNTKEYFCQTQNLKLPVSFLGLNIALPPNLIGSSDADFHKDSKSGLNSKVKKTPMSHLSKPLQNCRSLLLPQSNVQKWRQKSIFIMSLD